MFSPRRRSLPPPSQHCGARPGALRTEQLYAESEGGADCHGARFVEQVNRVERQAVLLLSAMRFIYVALGAFVAAALVTLLGAVLGQWETALIVRIVVGAGLGFGFIGVGGLVIGCVNLFQATRLSMMNIREEAALIRARQSARASSTVPAAGTERRSATAS